MIQTLPRDTELTDDTLLTFIKNSTELTQLEKPTLTEHGAPTAYVDKPFTHKLLHAAGITNIGQLTDAYHAHKGDANPYTDAMRVHDTGGNYVYLRGYTVLAVAYILVVLMVLDKHNADQLDGLNPEIIAGWVGIYKQMKGITD
jgi:hypothetical protein